MPLQKKPVLEISIDCLTCTKKSCQNCRHAIKETHKIFCTKLREYRKEPINCPEFDEEPREYRIKF